MKLALLTGADAGAGHLVRCLAVAQGAVARGWPVTLTPGADIGWLATEFAALGVRTRTELPADADAVLVDTYQDVTVRAPVLVSVEDGTFGRRRADIVVDQNLDPGPRPDDGSPVLLRGPRYALLRRSVRAARAARRPSDGPLHVAVTLGGSALAAPVAEDLAARLLATRIPLRCTIFTTATVPAGVTVHPPTPELPSHLATADLVISAAGVTLLESCCIGVPLALVCLADNQRHGYTAAVRDGLAAGIGTPGDLAGPTELTALLTDRARQAALAARAASVVDGDGVTRLLDQLHEYGM